MEKKDICQIVDGLLILFDRINITHTPDDLNGILTELVDVVNINKESIIKLVKYLRKIGSPDLKEAMNLYDYISFIDKLFTIDWKSSNFTMRDYDNIHTSLINIKELLSSGRVEAMNDEEAIRKMRYPKEELFIDDIFQKIEVDKLTTEQLISLYNRLFIEIGKRVMFIINPIPNNIEEG